MHVNSICVCGAGTMGTGIAQVAAQAGFYTILYDLNAAMIEKAKSSLHATLATLVKKEKISAEQREQTLQRIQFTSDIFNCMADVFIEAIAENEQWKVALFNQLAEINHSECIFASNTSSLSITKIAAQVKNPERVIGLHFFNPAPVMKLVEVVRTESVNDHTLTAILALAKTLGKTPVLCTDSPGFIVNRVARPYYLEALRLEEKYPGSFRQTDDLLEASGFKMGPFRLMDLIGNDINYAVSVSVYEQLDKPARLQPSPVQQRKVEQGELGKKSGKGYYPYE